MTTFSVISYFDPYGDEKSERKVFRREFFHTSLSKIEIQEIFKEKNKRRDYYDFLDIRFPKKPYKRTKLFVL